MSWLLKDLPERYRLQAEARLRVRTHHIEDDNTRPLKVESSKPRKPRKDKHQVKIAKVREQQPHIVKLLSDLRTVGLPEPVREHRFHPVRQWRFDLAFPERMVAVEVDGAVYAQGRHTRGKGFEDDCVKMNQAAVLGWRVFRYSTGQVKKGIPVADLKAVLE